MLKKPWILIIGWMVLLAASAGAATETAVPPLKAYLQALLSTAKAFDGAASAIFLSPGRDPDEKPTLAASLDEIIRYLGDSEPFSLQKAQRLPQAFTLGGTTNNRRGGMVAWHNDELIRGAESAKDETAIRNYVRGCLAGLLSQGEFCGLFTTPDSERAKLFSKGQVV